jgi:L-ascorbate metabolism protein UlaG (beta-lactamase superfamily)
MGSAFTRLQVFRPVLLGLAGAFVIGAIAVVGGACGLAAPGYVGKIAPNFNGSKFVNQVPVPTKSFWTVAKWKMASKTEPWQQRSGMEPGTAPPERVGMGDLRITWINHATALIQMDSVNILTDPIWSERPSPYSFIGPKRYRDPGLRFEDLPPIDVVVISHNHYDHFDVPTLARLAELHSPRIVAGLGSRAILEDEKISGGHDLDWWEELKITEYVAVTAVPAQHWSRRGLGDTNNTLWAGFVIRGIGGPVYYSGDTGWGPHFEQVKNRFGPIRLALLPIGAFEPRWFMKHMHISPQEAADAARILDAQVTVPVHWGTFSLGDDGQDEPPQVLEAYLRLMEDPPNFWVLDFGEGRSVRPLDDAATVVTQEETYEEQRSLR